MGQSREYDDLINGARFAARASGVGANFPPEITETERWEWPLIAEERGGQWFPAFDPGWALFSSTPQVLTDEGAPRVAPRRVLVCATSAQLGTLFPNGQQGPKVRALATQHGIGEPEFTLNSEVGMFWQSLFGNRWYLDGGTLPLLLLTTGQMRHHPPLAAETVTIENRLREVAELFGIRFEKITL